MVLEKLKQQQGSFGKTTHMIPTFQEMCSCESDRHEKTKTGRWQFMFRSVLGCCGPCFVHFSWLWLLWFTNNRLEQACDLWNKKSADYESETKSAGIIQKRTTKTVHNQPIWSHQSWSRSVGVQPCPAMSRLPTAPVQEVKDHKCPNPAILPARLGHKMSQRYTKVTIGTGSLELKSAVWPFLSLRFIQSQFRDDWTSPSHLGIVGRIHVAQDFLMEVQLG